jgi:secreted trypsin-like serine protease
LNRTTRLITLASILVLGLLAGAAPAAASDQPSNPGTVTPLIVGGGDASQPYPGLASLQLDHRGDPNWHTCAAWLYNPVRAVTNAHCVTNLPDGSPTDPGLYHLRIGSTDRLAGGTTRRVTKIVVPDGWTWGAGPGPVSDIAVLWLDRPVPLPTFPIARAEGDAATRIIGWGLTDPNGTTLPTTLQEVDSHLLPDSACAAAGITAGELCVANPHGAGACYGDSGGPALQQHQDRWAVIGGASRETDPVCGAGPGTVYTDVKYWELWIRRASLALIGPDIPRPTPPPTAPAPAWRWGTR